PNGLERLARSGVAGDIAAEESDQRDRGCERQRGADSPPGEQDRIRDRFVLGRNLLQLRRELGRRACGDQHVVDALQARPLIGRQVVPDQVSKFRWLAHESSPSNASASLERALRVRVLTVPSGIPTKSAISLCESPPQ